jgi:hypothetical protein
LISLPQSSLTAPGADVALVQAIAAKITITESIRDQILFNKALLSLSLGRG